MPVLIGSSAVAHVSGSQGFAFGRRTRRNFPQNAGLHFLPYKAANLFPGRVLRKCHVQPGPVARPLTHRSCTRYDRYN
ncbi:hypothetical protein EVAR_93002_1 [Eumeta japonica]|uniref:Uncharacterized protein n=1 Tax=Eumeta variegata TaxID=151549 RepID=A0A4C1TDZ8_EUMVA|nr:hypothetical protein EVAR_93002_1 [Eumeta japonica]